MTCTAETIWAHASALPADTEEQRRTKISRCYYALYTHACNFNDMLATKGQLLQRDSGTHRQLTQKLTNPTVTSAELINYSRQLGTKQMLAHELRVKADYNLSESVTQTDVIKCVGYVRSGLQIPLPNKAAA